MSTKLITVSPGDCVSDAVKGMVDNNISGMIVKDGAKAVGVVTMKDIVKKVLYPGKDVDKVLNGDVMSKPVLCVNPLNNLEKAADLMSKNRIKRLAVTDEENKVVGIITAMDIVSHIPDMIEVMFQTWVKPDWR